MATQVKLTRITSHRHSAVRPFANSKPPARFPRSSTAPKAKPEPLQVSKREISALLSHAAGENILVELTIEGEGTNRLAMVQEVQHAPIGGDVLHIDFHAISMDEMIEADVPLEPTGTANGVKNFGGLLEQSLRSLSIECLPRDLPDVITVDVSALNIGDAIHVRDIPLPAGVTTKNPPELTAFSVHGSDGRGRAGAGGGSADRTGSHHGEEGRRGRSGWSGEEVSARALASIASNELCRRTLRRSGWLSGSAIPAPSTSAPVTTSVSRCSIGSPPTRGSTGSAPQSGALIGRKPTRRCSSSR